MFKHHTFLLNTLKLSFNLRYFRLNNMNGHVHKSSEGFHLPKCWRKCYWFIFVCVCVRLSYQVLSSLPIDKTRSLPSLFCLPNVRIALSLSLSLLSLPLYFCVRISASPSHLRTLPLMKVRRRNAICVCVIITGCCWSAWSHLFEWTLNLLKWVSLCQYHVPILWLKSRSECVRASEWDGEKECVWVCVWLHLGFYYYLMRIVPVACALHSCGLSLSFFCRCVLKMDHHCPWFVNWLLKNLYFRFFYL